MHGPCFMCCVLGVFSSFPIIWLKKIKLVALLLFPFDVA